MGWFGKKTDAGTAGAVSQDRLPSEKVEEKPSCCQDRLDVVDQQAAPTESTQAGLPSIPAVFEFGGSAASGLQMRGICEVDDPDQIQACVWHVDKVPADRAKSTPKFQIAF